MLRGADVAPALLPVGLACGWALIVMWLIVRAARQHRAFMPLPVGRAPDDFSPTIAVILPARNEAQNIARSLGALLTQDYPQPRFTVTVVDDGSTDETAALAQRIISGRHRASVVSAGSLPSGWTGKCHACWQGAQMTDSEWLCFIDADTVPRSNLLTAAAAAARGGTFDLLSLAPRHELVTIWERLVIPSGLCILGFMGDRLPREAINGQFILIRRSVYERIGGHRMVRGAVAEDGALARLVVSSGGRIVLMDGASLISVRMYKNLLQLGEGLAKNVTETLGGARTTLSVVAAGFTLAWATVALPIILFLAAAVSAWSVPPTAAALLAVAASSAITGLHVAAARYFRLPWWCGLLFPIGYTLAAAIAVAGVIAQRRDRIAWKGRIYRAPVAKR